MTDLVFSLITLGVIALLAFGAFPLGRAIMRFTDRREVRRRTTPRAPRRPSRKDKPSRESREAVAEHILRRLPHHH